MSLQKVAKCVIRVRNIGYTSHFTLFATASCLTTLSFLVHPAGTLALVLSAASLVYIRLVFIYELRVVAFAAQIIKTCLF